MCAGRMNGSRPIQRNPWHSGTIATPETPAWYLDTELLAVFPALVSDQKGKAPITPCLTLRDFVHRQRVATLALDRPRRAVARQR